MILIGGNRTRISVSGALPKATTLRLDVIIQAFVLFKLRATKVRNDTCCFKQCNHPGIRPVF